MYFEAMNETVMEKSIDFVCKQANKLVLSFLRGEPLMEKKKLFYIQDEFKKRLGDKVKVIAQLSTNGLLLTDNFFRCPSPCHSRKIAMSCICPLSRFKKIRRERWVAPSCSMLLLYATIAKKQRIYQGIVQRSHGLSQLKRLKRKEGYNATIRSILKGQNFLEGSCL